MYVIGRSPRGRASLMHELSPDRDRRTLCGVDVRGRSQAYLDSPIVEVLCLRCITSRAKKDRRGRP